MASETKPNDLSNGSFSDIAGIEMVDLFVGPTKKLIRVHKAILCKKVLYFDKMFKEPWVESANNSATLSEGTVESFDLLVSWIHSGRLRELKYEENSSRFPWNPYSLYILCEKLCLKELMDEIMDHLRNVHRISNGMQSLNDIKFFYNGSQKGSGFRLYGLHTMIFVFRSSGPGYVTGWPTQLMQNILKDEDDLCKDFLATLRDEVSKGKAITDPRVGNNCVYHSHNMDKECVRKQNKLKRSSSAAGLSN